MARGGWLAPSLLALFCWGLWGFLTKLGARQVNWQTMMVIFAAATLAVGLLAGPGKLRVDGWHLLGLGAGVAGAVGFYFFYIALSRGPATVVIPLTSLYVVVAALLAALLLAEPVTLRVAAGVVCAVAAVMLLAV